MQEITWTELRTPSLLLTSKGSTLRSLNIPMPTTGHNCAIWRGHKNPEDWFKFLVEKGIQKHWWEISAPPPNPLFMEALALVLANIGSESIRSQQLHPQPHPFFCWVLLGLFFFFCNIYYTTITMVVQTESGLLWPQPLLRTLTSLQQCSSPPQIPHCPSCSILITLYSYFPDVTSDALHSQAQIFQYQSNIFAL